MSYDLHMPGGCWNAACETFLGISELGCFLAEFSTWNVCFFLDFLCNFEEKSISNHEIFCDKKSPFQSESS